MRTGLLVVVLSSLVAAATGGCSQAQSAAIAARTATFTVERATVGRAIPAGFVGLSIEFRGLEAYVGSNPRAVNPVFEQLIRNLAPNQRPILRIGGDSTDWTWWPTHAVRRPAGIRYDLNRRWLEVARSLRASLGAQLILGLNLEADSRQVAVAEANAMIGGLGRKSIAAFELGNEANLYGALGWYHTPDGRYVLGRPRSYNFDGYLRDFSNIGRPLPNVALAGPGTGAPTWMRHLGRFLNAEPRVRLATLHAYPLKHCHGRIVTLAQLTSNAATRDLGNGIAPYTAIAHARHLPLRIDEMNAVACGGEHGVSDTFASALWALDALFEMTRVGVDGVNIHTVPSTINDLIASNFSAGRWHADVHPQYYGMMMFADATPPGSRLLRIRGATDGGVHAWATRSPTGQVRVVLINDDTHRPQVVTLRTSAQSPATLERLEAPSINAKSGVTLAGQSFGSNTTTGLLAGPLSTASVTPTSGRYVIRLRAASAAMLTLPMR